MPISRIPCRTVAAVALLAALAAPTAAAAHEGHDPENDGPVPAALEQPAADAADVAIIAADKGWTVAATTDHMTTQAKFGDLVDAVATRFPAGFAGAEFAETPGGPSYLRFKGTVPAGAKRLAADSGLPVKLTGGRSHNAIQLEARANALAAFLVESGYTQAVVAVLPTGTLEASATGAKITLPASLRKGVRMTFVTDDVSVDHHTWGGAYIHGGGSQCTTGFAVESQITGVTGVTTAAHCSGPDHYHQPQTANPVIAYDTYRQDQHLGLWGDVEWHTTDHFEQAFYYADVTDFREVNSVETSAAVNNTYCVYSRMQSNRYCDDVWSTYVVQVSGSGITSDLIGMDDSNTVGGDSGGPWSYGTQAAGIVKGAVYVPFGWHDTWSKAWRFDSALDVEVLTQ